MNNFDRLRIPGTETHAHPAHCVSATPSPEFPHEVAQLLEIEPVETLAEPDDVDDDVDSEGAQQKHSRPEGGIYKWYTTSGRGDPHDSVSSLALY